MSCLNFSVLAAQNGSDLVEAGGSMQAVGAGLRGVSSLAGGISRASALRAQAAAEVAAGQRTAGTIRRAAGKELGAARAAAAASGVAVDSGSVMDAERDIVRYSEQDALTAILTGQTRAYAAKSAASSAQTQGLVDAGENLLVGADAWKRTRRNRNPYAIGYGGGGGVM